MMSAFEATYTGSHTKPQIGQKLALSVGVLILLALGTVVWSTTGLWRLTSLTGIGALIGFVLHRSDYGFAGSFRALIEQRDASALKSHALMLIILSLIALPVLSLGEVFGQRLVGVVTPVGVAFVIGALIFGVGMQLGSGCASGTLYGLGGGDVRLAVTLAGFISGSTLGASHMGWWWTLPKIEAFTLLQNMALGPALVMQAVSLGLFWGIAHLIGRSCDYPETRIWSLAQGAIALALLNAVVLLVSGQPWGEAPAFALWGSKIAAFLGVDVLWWDYWARPGFDRQIEQSILFDSVSVLNISIVVGALIAASLAGQFRLRAPKGKRVWIAAILGGVMMGYGARLTNGCNIGAYVSGVGTGATSGWVWLVFALAGSYVGVKIRPIFGLARSARTDGTGC
jgi:uncharacterized protein